MSHLHAPRSALRRSLTATVLVGALALLAACSGAPQPSGADRIDVLASFYPLQFAAQEIGGDRVSVSNLTPPGAEPHDLELSPAAVRTLGEADLVVVLSGMQAATDEAVAQLRPEHVVDAASQLDGESIEATSLDPHFWLDPMRMAALGHEIADELSAIDPAHAAEYAQRADDLERRLGVLDAEFSEGLAQCSGATLVTSHEAFGYLAQRYDLHQVGISGINPDVEPAPARLREVRAVVVRDGVRTLYFEVLVSPKVTTVLAEDLGVSAAVLDPLEGHADTSADYFTVMRANLAALTSGLACG
ncbi:zinc transport system substrate-binding protein [Sanguibacter gelidistatuariae]|uniref:Zinc transport system substrate-binding protein n=1 Tax=Sanguibacter gelidistatuariae TaxID=1814289 RepID=A0A1G6GZ51_9MICO|nr:metal ABC transporter substrate-binding protein [Sanguibacter gelidistatuariae]SDB86386.1 zinc transport system substrate-binding protein [Sanguibacter gelidistatuariae]